MRGYPTEPLQQRESNFKMPKDYHTRPHSPQDTALGIPGYIPKYIDWKNGMWEYRMYESALQHVSDCTWYIVKVTSNITKPHSLSKSPPSSYLLFRVHDEAFPDPVLGSFHYRLRSNISWMHRWSRPNRRLCSRHQRQCMLQQISMELADFDLYRWRWQCGEAETGMRCPSLLQSQVIDWMLQVCACCSCVGKVMCDWATTQKFCWRLHQNREKCVWYSYTCRSHQWLFLGRRLEKIRKQTLHCPWRVWRNHNLAVAYVIIDVLVVIFNDDMLLKNDMYQWSQKLS